jgi:hypothetical protein
MRLSAAASWVYTGTSAQTLHTTVGLRQHVCCLSRGLHAQRLCITSFPPALSTETSHRHMASSVDCTRRDRWAQRANPYPLLSRFRVAARTNTAVAHGPCAARGTDPRFALPPDLCPLCRRPLYGKVTRHHLYPKKYGKQKKYQAHAKAFPVLRLHALCHRMIHALFSAQELAEHFHTMEALRAHPAMQAFLQFIAAKPPGFDVRVRRPKKT